MNKKISTAIKSTPFRLIVNLLWLYIAYGVCRVAFILENWSAIGTNLTYQSLWQICLGGFRFDSSAIFYTNALFILLYLLPVHTKENLRWYRGLAKWLYVLVNGLCVIINLADSVFFEYRLQRSTMATFTEFRGEGNLWSIAGIELLSHWYFVLLAAALIYGFIRLYKAPAQPRHPLWHYYVTNSVTLIVMGFLAVCGMRGNVLFLSATRPISINYAFRFVNTPPEAGAVLNTPFSLIRTIGQTTIKTPTYFATPAQLDAVYSPLKQPSDSTVFRKKNVVILIVESFAQEFIGGLNHNLDNGRYKGYTPWADEMLDSCMWFDQTFDNTGFSIDAPPAVFCSIPRVDRPFVVSPHSVNHINSLATELKTKGYTSAFFHGADNESLGFHAFTRQIGFDRYYGQNEFYADTHFGGRAEFDGTWGVWDEPFLQFFKARLDEMPQPFLASVFTLTSHHPFKVPEKYRDLFVDEGAHQIHKCIRYTDYSLRRFFDEARKSPWFANTVFVITADHASSKRTHAEYKNELGGCRIPILFYDPSGELPRGRQPGIAQQIDIMPTLLSYLGYDRPYVAFGKDLLTTPTRDTWAFNWNRIPMYIKGDYVMMFENDRVKALYNYRTDPLLQHDLKGTGLSAEADMRLHIKAIIQSYLERMNSDNVTAKPTNNDKPTRKNEN